MAGDGAAFSDRVLVEKTTLVTRFGGSEVMTRVTTFATLSFAGNVEAGFPLAISDESAAAVSLPKDAGMAVTCGISPWWGVCS